MKTWAEQLTKDVFQEWERKYRFWKPGFKIFYGPVKRNPKIMILSANPGGDKDSFKGDLLRFRKGDFSLPIDNEYFSKPWHIARRIRNLFDNKQDLLKESIAFPIFFFRSKSARALKQYIPTQQRIEMELFCYRKVRKILKEVKPKKLLILGFGTYEKFLDHLFVKAENEETVNGTKRIVIKTRWNSLPLFCLIHPTGARIKGKDWEKARKDFREFLNDG